MPIRHSPLLLWLLLLFAACALLRASAAQGKTASGPFYGADTPFPGAAVREAAPRLGLPGSTTIHASDVPDTNNRQLHPDERKFISNKAKELAAQTCKAGDTQCLTSAQRYWSDQLTAEAEAADDSKLSQQRNRYLSQVAATGQIPGMEGQTSGAAMKYLQDAQIARNALSEIKGQTILGTDGKPIMADGSTLTYFSGTQAQRDDHNLYAVRPGMYDTRVSSNGSANEVVSQQDIMLRTQRDGKRLINLSATNGAALPDYPVEEFVLGGGPGLVKGAAETVLSLARKSVAGSVDKAAVDAALAKAAESSSSTALPEGYAPLKSVGAAANDTGGLPAGFRRVVNQATGDVQVLGSDGRIYNEVTQGGKDVLVPVAKGGANTVHDEINALNQIGKNPNGADLTGKAPNSVLNQQAINDLNAGVLPGKPIGGPGTPREMPMSSNPSATAEDFANRFFGGSTPVNAKPIAGCDGCWRAQTSDGSWVTYRPAGQASAETLPTTATVEVNGATVNAINASSKGKPVILKLKFPLSN